MRSIKARFKKVEAKHPEYSSYLAFADAIWGENFCKDKLVRHFNKLVEKEDYDKAEKKAVVRFLLSLTRALRNTENKAKMPQIHEESTNYEYIPTYQD
jgi:negative regulator of replication initiation